MAQGEKLAFLSTCWSSHGNGNTYVLGWCGELEDPNQIVTSLTCLPMTQNKSTDGAIEWTCVAVGLCSGMVTFYTDSGVKLFSQWLVVELNVSTALTIYIFQVAKRIQ